MHVFIEGMMIQDIQVGGSGSQNLHHNKGVPGKLDKEVVSRNSSPERNLSLPEDDQIMHSKIGLHLVKIHVLIIFLMSKVSKVLCVKYSRINCMHVGGVERSTCTVHILYTALLFQAR